MQKILWLGESYFAASLESCGWERVFIYHPPEYSVFSWRELVNLAGFEPDALVVADSSTPPPVLDMEEFPCLTVFYSVDSHIHSWHPLYGQGFDACLVSLGDHVARFENRLFGPGRVLWSPAFSRESDAPEPNVAKVWDCLFVGNIKRELMPKRYAFLKELGQRIPSLQVKYGNYRELFAKSRVLVNQAEAGDLNFRVFEALGCGGCLVTPRLGHGMAKMFVDGEHLVCYRPDDVGDAAYRIKFLLDNPELCEYIARTGFEEVNQKHRPIHRAQAFTDHLCDLAVQGVEEIVAARIRNAAAIRSAALSLPYLHFAETLSDPDQREMFFAASRGQFGLEGIAV